jgi:nucleotide-binding universal stress UspA family protein
MKRYLVPVDYSEVAVNALRYTLDMCSSDDIVDVIYVHSGLLTISEAPIVSNLPEIASIEKDKIEKFIAKSIDRDTHKVNYLIAHGEIVSQIIAQSKNKTYNAIIAGTRDKYDLFDKLLGTISLGIVKRSTIPVLLVPPLSKYDGFDSLVIGADSHLKSDVYLESLKKWNQTHLAYMHLVNVSSPASANYIKAAEKIITSFFEKEEVPFMYSIEKVESEDVVPSLLDKAKEHDADLIILLPERQDFFSSLFISSVSKEVILKSTYPVLFFR